MDALTNLPGDLLNYYNQGGFVMHLISILSVFSLTTIIYKLIVFKRVKLNLNEFISKVAGRCSRATSKARPRSASSSAAPSPRS